MLQNKIKEKSDLWNMIILQNIFLATWHERKTFWIEISTKKTKFWNLGTLEVAQKIQNNSLDTDWMKNNLLIT